MKILTLEEIKKIEVELLIDLTKICEENKLRYYLTGGTLLGAVKYQGFIPWDDDIDLALPRKDFKKLIEILEERKDSKYKMLSIYHTKDMYYPFGKYVDTETVLFENAKKIKEYGVYLDVYPLDGVPDKKQEKFLKRLNIYKNFSYSRWESKNTLHKQFSFSKSKKSENFFKIHEDFIRKMFNIITKPLGFQFWVKLLDKKCQKYDFENAKYVGVICHRYTPKQIFLKQEYEPQANYIFEGREFTATKNADMYLTQLYGEYKKDPPKEEQRTHHSIEAYWRDEVAKK